MTSESIQQIDEDVRHRVLLLDFGAVISKSLFETVGDIERCFALDTNSLKWSGPLKSDPLNEGQDELWMRMRSGAISERQYWYTRAEELSAMTGEELRIQDIVRRSRPVIDDVCRPEALHAVEASKRAGVRVAIMTNELLLFYGEKRVLASRLLSRMDHIFDASYTNILKPNPRAYAMVVAGLGVKAEDIVFVDDQIANVDGGREAGFCSIHLDLTKPGAAFDVALAQLGIPEASPVLPNHQRDG